MRHQAQQHVSMSIHSGQRSPQRSMPSVTTHEPAAMIIGTTLPYMSTGSGRFSTAEAGNAHVQRKGRQPFISAALAAHSSIKKATADGNCASHVFSLAVKHQLSSDEEVKQVKNSLISGVLEWVLGKELAAEVAAPQATSDDFEQEITPQQLQKLTTLTDNVNASRERARNKMIRTIDWVHQNVTSSIMGGRLGVPLLAIVAAMTSSNIAVWEPADEGTYRLYENDGQQGLFIADKGAEACCINMLYNSNAGSTPLVEKTWKYIDSTLPSR